ncbi:MBL fold metallo-hydrolase [Uliginosibacterium sp. TH139]|uniref:MBL fold metallo-hydrolase n=1 Tax=Uliginosibacterium sp. TH139 TaxID=2067453 RepID=UPI000C7C62AE|nr:MBL fold metallo-hydrolase [Uliginosibacterium sp. TH139]PLK50742.1 Zn-dependent hydrolase [Uliginosibacterium sp. TH139]
MSRLIEYPFTLAPEAPALLEVAAGVRWLRMALPWSLNHINLWLLDDGEGVALVDTGLGDPPSRGLWTAVLEQLGRPLTKIIATHYHPDHLGNAEWLSAATGAPIWISMAEYLLAHALHAQTSGFDMASQHAHFQRHGLDADRLAKMNARGNIYRRGVPTLPSRYRRLIDGDVLEIGGRGWHAIAGYGHSPEHIALHCAEAGLLISGDMLLPRISTNISVPAAMPEEDSVGRFLSSLERFRPLPADTLVLPAHGLPFRGIPARVDQLVAHHAERDATMLAAMRKCRSAAELLPVLFPRELDPHQLMFALGEAIAHLNHLCRQGRAQRIEEAEGLIRYQALD